MRILLLSAALLLPCFAFGHGGGLDRNGGHFNRKTGVYHCHREPCFSNQGKARGAADQPAEKPGTEKGQSRGDEGRDARMGPSAG